MDARRLPIIVCAGLIAGLAACGPSITPGLAPPGTIGYGCAAAADCTTVEAAECLQMDGGYCAKDCSTLGQFDCPDEAVCHQLSDQANYCLDGCLSTSDCRSGYRCAIREDLRLYFPDGAGVCLPACVSDADCDPGQVCKASGECVAKVGASAGTGAACGANAQCNSGLCLTGADFAGGYCSSACGGHLAECESGSACLQVPSGTSFCMKVCTSDGDCREGYACDLVDSGDGNAKGFCVPPFSGQAAGTGCTEVLSCGGTEVWDASACACAAGATSAGQVGDLAAQTVTVTSYGSEAVSFDVPEGAVSFTIVADAGGYSLLALATLKAPDGTQVYNVYDPYASSFVSFATDSVYVSLVPNTPQMPFSAGRWSATFATDGGNVQAAVRVIGKDAEGVPSIGKLDLHLYFVGLEEFDAAGARQDPVFQATIARVRELYGQAGVVVGDVTYHDVGGSAAIEYAVVDSIQGAGNEMAGVLAQSDPSAGPGLNFFFVREIVGGQDGYVILGIAGGIPGPPDLSGGPHSGVLVGMTDYADGAEQFAQTMAHEGGHFLGLYHTSESSGTSFDPLAGTPECPASRDANFDGYVSPQECKGYGVENLMFWSAASDASGLVSDQAFVLLRNPSVR